MDPIVSFTLNNTLGALEIGVLVSFALFGVTTTQLYIYYSRFPDDSRKLKALVAFVWLCEVAHTACLGHLLYTDTILDYARPDRVVGSSSKSLPTASFFAGIVAVCVHGFFSFRIYVFTKKMYITGVIWVMAFLHLLGRIALFVTSLRAHSLEEFIQQWQWLLTTNWTISVATDFAITTTLVVVLHGRRSQAHKKTAALMDKLIAWTIETGMLTSASSIAMLISFVTMKDNFIWLAFFAVSTRLFSNSLLSSLNSRATLRVMNEVALPYLAPALELLPSNSVQITKVTQIMYDAEPSTGQCDKGPEDA
ncbi:hypothetical protein MVEN_00812700 [Mycena venus]|uniref:DUF6534 domain-containing protein n=1 Tax=Mycena venus TaxID=2733690 RepID=A0A8H7D664_9AGAR|nr:hypothetical protein MVEN_00812700 [Mycena venus]